jgi:acyl-CoA thioesterase-1
MRICFIGDSFINGTGDDTCLGWTGRICSHARQRGRDITPYNLGVRRDTTGDIAERWQREARARLPPEHDGRLVFSFGVNDCVSEQPCSVRIVESASLIFARGILTAANAWLPTLMIGPPPTADPELNQRVEHLSLRLGVLCEDLSIPFLSTWNPLISNDTWMREVAAADGAHPNSAGYAILADLILNWPPWQSWINETHVKPSQRRESSKR